MSPGWRRRISRRAGLYTTAARALHRWNEIRIERLPRMADFARRVTAGEPALGWANGDFIEAYTANRRRSTESAIECDPVAQAVRDLADERDWQGTPTATLAELEMSVSDAVNKGRIWPSVNKLKGRLRRAQAPLRSFGIVIDLELRSGGPENRRLIGIRKTNR